MCKEMIYLVSLVLILSVASGVQAAMITIGSDADTYIQNDTVYGNEVYMYLHNANFVGYLRFDLAAHNVLSVESATLTLTYSGNAPRNDTLNNGRFALSGLDNVAGNTPQDWDETFLSASNVGAEYGTNSGDPLVNVTSLNDDIPGITEDVVATGANYWDPGGTTVTISGDALASFIQSRIDDNGLVTFLLEFPGGGSGRGYGLASKENTTEEWRPRLELVAVIGAKTPATKPNPADEAQDVPRDVTLSWIPGELADKHNVYLGTSFNDVNSAGPGSPELVGPAEDANSYDAGRLEFDQTYYWRVDEVNAPPDSTVFRGPVWSFTIESLAYPIPGENITATASSSGEAGFGPEKTIDGSGLDADGLHSTGATDMWLSGDEPLGAWIQYELDSMYKLHEMWVWNSNQVFEGLFGFGMKDVAVEYSIDGVEWTALAGVPEFARAPGTDGYAHNTTVGFGGAVAKYVRLTARSNWGGILPQYGLSEVRFFYIPVIAREPSPDSGAGDVDVDVTLSWRPGRQAAEHNVYLSTDEQAVIDGTAPAVTVTDASYSPPPLDLDVTYYWRVDEVNNVEDPAMWQGDVWNFTTQEYFVVDDFEAYNDLNPDDPQSNRIFLTWIGGDVDPANGSQVGHDTFPFAEPTVVYGGVQSMPLFYDNSSASYSEATVNTDDLAIGRDWTLGSPRVLVLWFYGSPGNTGNDRLYVKIGDSKFSYDGDIARPQWKPMIIDLTGVNLNNVSSLTVGVERAGGSGGSGVVFVDEIGLAASAPAVPSEEIWVEAEVNTSITAPMMIYDDPDASGGQYVSTEAGTADEGTAPPYPNGTVSIPFTVEGGTYTARLRIGFPGGDDSCWVRIQDATITSPVHSSGWIHFNDIPTGDYWHWSQEVKSEDEPGEPPVEFTLSAGTHNLEISYRGADLRIDAIVFSRID